MYELVKSKVFFLFCDIGSLPIFKNLLSWKLLLSQIVVIQCRDIMAKELLNSWPLVACMFHLWVIKGISCLGQGAWSGQKWMVFWICWPQLFSLAGHLLLMPGYWSELFRNWKGKCTFDVFLWSIEQSCDWHSSHLNANLTE